MSFTQPREYGISRFKDWAVPKRKKTEEEKALKKEREEIRAVNKNELVEDLLDVILKHKKEIKKVPQCTYLQGAQQWAAKRRLEAREMDLDTDGTPEVIVFDKDGKTPYVVNGYRLVPSDYPVRRKYWSTHETESSRVKEPMGDWIRNNVYEYDEDATNMWKKNKIRMKELGHELSKWDGFRMPSKPKKLASPYSIFSKLIAPMIKNLFRTKWLMEKMGVDNVVYNASDLTTTNAHVQVWNKIISPITMYRYLYLKLVEQKFYFYIVMKMNDFPFDNPKTLAEYNYTYEQFKKDLKKHKDDYYGWFYARILSGTRKEKFNTNEIKESLIKSNMIEGDADFENNDANDGLIQLFGGVDAFKDQTPIYYDSDGTPSVFKDIITNEECAQELLDILEDREHPQYRDVKYQIALAKERAARWVKEVLFADEGLSNMMNSQKAFSLYILSENSTKGKSGNITSGEALQEYIQGGGSLGSPVKQMREAPEEDENEAPGGNEEA